MATLIHTGLVVPDPAPVVTAVRQLEMAHGVAFVASVLLLGKPIGTFENDGRGGPTEFVPRQPQHFGPRDLDAVATRCRLNNEPISGEELMDLLIEEHDLAHAVVGFPTGDSTVARLVAHGYTIDYAIIPLLTNPSRRARVARDLTASRPETVGIWHQWSGERWEPLRLPDAGEDKGR